MLPTLDSTKSGRVDETRTRVFAGRERHSHARYDNQGYPSRAIRTRDRLYIRNFKPDRWPAGDPELYADIDNGPSKTYMMENRSKPGVDRLFAIAFGKRPEEELYDLRKDPGQLSNVAADPAYALELRELRGRLMGELELTNDPRVVGGGEKFDAFPYLGGGPKHPEWERRNK